ncbi:hypothetical protein [Streptomyces rhizosphaericus]
MEKFPSVERASVALQLRARTQESGTFFLGEEVKVPPVKAPFPEADLTGFMVVWVRRANEPAPHPTDQPDEVWRLTPHGGVRRHAWEDDQKTPHAAPADILRGRVIDAPLTPARRRRRVLKAAAQLPPLTEEYTLEFDPMTRQALEDLVQDTEALDAVLRFMQARDTARKNSREAR